MACSETSENLLLCPTDTNKESNLLYGYYRVIIILTQFSMIVILNETKVEYRVNNTKIKTKISAATIYSFLIHYEYEHHYNYPQ